MTIDGIKEYCKSKHRATEDFPEDEIKRMIADSYDLVVTKKKDKI